MRAALNITTRRADGTRALALIAALAVCAVFLAAFAVSAQAQEAQSQAPQSPATPQAAASAPDAPPAQPPSASGAAPALNSPPIAIVPLDKSIPGAALEVAGPLQAWNGRAFITGSGTITAGNATAQVTLPYRGTLHVCASSTVKLAADSSTPAGEVPGLLIALDHGAVEMSFAASTARERNADTQVCSIGHGLWWDRASEQMREEAPRQSNTPRRPKMYEQPHAWTHPRHESRHRIVDRQRTKKVQAIPPTTAKSIRDQRVDAKGRHGPQRARSNLEGRAVNECGEERFAMTRSQLHGGPHRAELSIHQAQILHADTRSSPSALSGGLGDPASSSTVTRSALQSSSSASHLACMAATSRCMASSFSCPSARASASSRALSTSSR